MDAVVAAIGGGPASAVEACLSSAEDVLAALAQLLRDGKDSLAAPLAEVLAVRLGRERGLLEGCTPVVVGTAVDGTRFCMSELGTPHTPPHSHPASPPLLTRSGADGLPARARGGGRRQQQWGRQGHRPSGDGAPAPLPGAAGRHLLSCMGGQVRSSAVQLDTLA